MNAASGKVLWKVLMGFSLKKTKNLDLYEWNAWKRGKIRSYQWRKSNLGRKISGEEVWGGEESESIERDRWEMKKNVLMLYTEKHEARWIERYREVSSFKSHQMELSRSYREVSTAKWPRWIEKLSSIQKLPQWIEKLSRSYRDKFSKTLMDQELSRAVEN